MKTDLIRVALALVLLSPAAAYSQVSHGSFEFGLGGSAINHTRTMVSDFHQTKGGDYVFTLEQKLLYGGLDLYSAKELKRWLYADVQATLGIASYYDQGDLIKENSVLAGPGIQIRPPVGKGCVQPYFRLGISYFHKEFPTTYFGPFKDDVTKEAVWKAEDSWNKGYTFDSGSYFPMTAGIGLVGWLSDRVGVRLEADCFRSLGSKGASFARGAFGLVFRLGGENKSTHEAVPARVVEKIVEKEVVREVPVEKVKEVIKEVPCDRTIALLMENVTFDFDKADLTCQSDSVLNEVARIMLMEPDARFVICGYTDAVGNTSYNERLSIMRARAVLDALKAKGVPEEMLLVRGFGKRDAVLPDKADNNLRRGDRKVVIERVTWKPLWDYLKEHNLNNLDK